MYGSVESSEMSVMGDGRRDWPVPVVIASSCVTSPVSTENGKV